MPNTIVRKVPFRKRGQRPWYFSRSLQLADVTGSGGVLIGGSATVSYGNAGLNQVVSDIVVEWDFDNDGDFSDSVEDITSYVLNAETFSGRDWPSLLTGFAGPGKFRATLNNNDDRFSYFNTDSPLNAGSFSLKTGRKLRVRTSTSSSPDPTLITKDRFNRSDGPLGSDENSMAWSQPTAAQFLIESNQAVAQTEGSTHIAFINAGAADYYAQVKVEVAGNISDVVGLVFRYVDASNYSFIAVNKSNDTVGLFNVIAGVQSTVNAVSFDVYSGVTLGVLLSSTSVIGYVDGVPLLSGTAIQTSATDVGIYCRWVTGDIAPQVDNFYVWSGLTAETEGILWTGDVSDLVASVSPGPIKTVQLSGEGWLSKLATQRVTPPTSVAGRKTGVLMGNILNQAGLANPPGPIDEGDITTGAFAGSDQDAISVARDVEETEFGFLFETQEGPLGFDSRSARDGLSVVGGLSDASGAQFGYHGIAPYDWRREVFNRVVAGVSPLSAGVEAVLYTDPGPYVLSAGQTQDLVATYSGNVAEWTGHTRDITTGAAPSFADVTSTSSDADTTDPFLVNMPATVNAGDLLVTIFYIVTLTGESGTPSGTNTVPTGWTKIQELDTSGDGTVWLAVGAKIADGTEDGTTPNWTRSDNLTWTLTAQTYRFSGVYSGTVSDFVEASSFTTTGTTHPNPPSITQSWGSESTTYIAATIVYGFDPINVTTYPSGYSGGTENDNTQDPIFFQTMGTARKTASASSEDPGTFTIDAGVDGPLWSDSITIAVRGTGSATPVSSSTPSGTSGAFTISYDVGIGGTTQSHTNIEVTGIPLVEGDAVSVQLDDTDSQDDHNAIRTYRNPANLFANTSDATEYAQLVLDTFAGDRPILSVSFYPVKNAGYRNLAIRRRIGDKITVVATNNAGLGISQDFFIESISHKFSYGTTLWETTWELSPA